MPEEYKMSLIRERFSEILAWVETKKIHNYEDVSAREKAFFADVFQSVFKNDKQLFSELWQKMGTCTAEMIDKNKELEKDFNLKEHLRTHYQDCLGKNKYFEDALNSESISYSPKVENLYSTLQYLSDDQSVEYKAEAKKILDKILSTKGKANQKLFQALENTDITFRISSGKNMDGKCIYERLKPNDKNETLTIVLSEGCFAQHRKGLEMVMCHELGHFIDRIGRPKGYDGGLPRAQEFFADALGYDMARNCGFDVEYFKTENKKFNNDFLNERMSKLSQLQLQDDVRKKMIQNVKES